MELARAVAESLRAKMVPVGCTVGARGNSGLSPLQRQSRHGCPLHLPFFYGWWGNTGAAGRGGGVLGFVAIAKEEAGLHRDLFAAVQDASAQSDEARFLVEGKGAFVGWVEVHLRAHLHKA
ncbi:hypothetical protein EC9_03170 [Rosistilla ulvae]|uniref:Uncharacterized protein n=1 Tax=Rosistilla ulvae TaxID=1930277 RepID=A0A517LU55_9BACT|nr:hypothetical protein EC9_03170 [Rosistilla ulvae]